jgi:hypothetical protein
LDSCPPLPEEGPINAKPAPDDSGTPKAGDNQDGDEDEGSLEGSDSTLSPPLADSEAQGAEKKRKRTEYLTSSGTSNRKDVLQKPTISKDTNFGTFGLLDL